MIIAQFGWPFKAAANAMASARFAVFRQPITTRLPAAITTCCPSSVVLFVEETIRVRSFSEGTLISDVFVPKIGNEVRAFPFNYQPAIRFIELGLNTIEATINQLWKLMTQSK